MAEEQQGKSEQSSKSGSGSSRRRRRRPNRRRRKPSQSRNNESQSKEPQASSSSQEAKKKSRRRRRRRKSGKSTASSQSRATTPKGDRLTAKLPESIFVYTHVVRSSGLDTYGFRSDPFMEHSRDVVDFRIDLSAIFPDGTTTEDPADTPVYDGALHSPINAHIVEEEEFEESPLEGIADLVGLVSTPDTEESLDADLTGDSASETDEDASAQSEERTE